MGRIITFTGASGSGKSTIVKELLNDSNYKIVLSITTREKRESDLLGEYNYISLRDFEELDRSKQFAWSTPLVHGNKYGTLKESILETLTDDRNNLMILIPEVIPILRRISPVNVYSFYIKSPSEKVLVKRLTERGDSQESIDKRILECKDYDAKIEASRSKDKIDYKIITNEGPLEVTIKEVLRKIQEFN